MTTRPVFQQNSVEENSTSTSKIRCNKVEKKHTFDFVWTIATFTHFLPKKTGEYLESSALHNCADENLKCSLYLYPNGLTNNYKDFLSLKILLKSSKRCFYKYSVVCSILNAEKKKFCICKTEAQNWLLNGIVYFSDNFCERKLVFDPRHNLLTSSKLTISCDISITENNQTNVVKFEDTDNLEHFLDNEEFSDVTFAVGDRELRAHKIILAARSEVFAAMFRYKMDESISNRVTITDVDYEVLKELLHFIYKGEAPNLDKMAHDLFVAADKYHLKTLKAMCEYGLSKEIGIETAVKTLILADRHALDLLKKRSIDFIKTHISDVLTTPDFQRMITTYPELVTNLFEAFDQLVKQIKIHN